MPAQIVDELDENGQLPRHATEVFEGLEARQAAPQQPEALLGEDVPEKYRGKTARELLDIVVNQDSHIGRQGQELGTLRNEVGTLKGLVDQSLALRDSGHSREEVGTEEDLSDDDFILNPRDAVSRTVKRETRENNERLARLEQQAAAIDFGRRHPTANADVQDPQFVEFVQKSQFRAQLANRAFGNPNDLDFDAAEELWGLWEDYRAMVPESAPASEAPTENETASHSEAASQVPQRTAPQMVTSGSSGDVGGSHKPTYSQAALNRLQAENPDLYWATDTQNKINEARAEGRVLQDV